MIVSYNFWLQIKKKSIWGTGMTIFKKIVLFSKLLPLTNLNKTEKVKA